jgi:hypothetical protein
LIRQRHVYGPGPRFYEHLEKFSGEQQIFVVDNTDPPPEYAFKGIHFTANEKFGRYGLFPREEANGQLGTESAPEPRALHFREIANALIYQITCRTVA